jgi:hypothetical protein
MKTVRLPIFEDGIETRDYLEVDINFWISSTKGLRSNLARIVEPNRFLSDLERDPSKEEPLADWERNLLEGTVEDYAASDVALCEKFYEATREDEWRTIEGLPTKSFEVNQRGQIRIKANRKILEPSLDLDSKNYMTVNVKINGLDFYINGPKLAEQMWSKV